MYDYKVNSDELKDGTHSMKPVFGLSKNLDLPTQCLSVERVFRLAVDYNVAVQVKQGICKTMKCPEIIRIWPNICYCIGRY